MLLREHGSDGGDTRLGFHDASVDPDIDVVTLVEDTRRAVVQAGEAHDDEEEEEQPQHHLAAREVETSAPAWLRGRRARTGATVGVDELGDVGQVFDRRQRQPGARVGGFGSSR